MATITLRGDGVRRAMRSAARKGFDPYNSWDTQAACAAKALRDVARRARDPYPFHRGA